jgi:hypothetical protein
MKRKVRVAGAASAMFGVAVLLCCAPLGAQTSDRTMPSAGATPGAVAVGGHHNPTQMSDCAKEGWRGYSNPRFKNQKSCEDFVQRHKKAASRAPAPGRKPTTTPKSR